MYYFYGKLIGGTFFVHCMEAVRISEGLLWEVPLHGLFVLPFPSSSLLSLCTPVCI